MCVCSLTLQIPQSSPAQQSSSPLIFSSQATAAKTKSKRTPGRYMKIIKTLKNSQETLETLILKLDLKEVCGRKGKRYMIWRVHPWLLGAMHH